MFSQIWVYTYIASFCLSASALAIWAPSKDEEDYSSYTPLCFMSHILSLGFLIQSFFFADEWWYGLAALCIGLPLFIGGFLIIHNNKQSILTSDFHIAFYEGLLVIILLFVSHIDLYLSSNELICFDLAELLTSSGYYIFIAMAVCVWVSLLYVYFMYLSAYEMGCQYHKSTGITGLILNLICIIILVLAIIFLSTRWEWWYCFILLITIGISFPLGWSIAVYADQASGLDLEASIWISYILEIACAALMIVYLWGLFH